VSVGQVTWYTRLSASEIKIMRQIHGLRLSGYLLFFSEFAFFLFVEHDECIPQRSFTVRTCTHTIINIHIIIIIIIIILIPQGVKNQRAKTSKIKKAENGYWSGVLSANRVVQKR